MEETNERSGNDRTNSQFVRRKVASPCLCVVCGDVARYSYYGAIVCHSCKVFFRRNARSHPTPLICKFGDHCEIDINSRRSCSSCRLAKCFASGMTIDLIRPDRITETNSNETTLVRTTENRQPQMIRRLNLLERDQSTLSRDQWNDLSNLIHCFDEYNGLEYVQQFVNEQNALPIRIRYKYQTVYEFFQTMMSKVQILFEKNRDILHLSIHDRKLLLRCTIAYTTSIGDAFLLQQTHLLDDSIFFRSAQSILGFSTIDSIKHLIHRFNLDIIVVKILFSIMSFLISNYTRYEDTPSDSLIDEKSLLNIQDTYTELTWRYLIYKYNYDDAVLCFSNFVRCLFLLNDSVVKAYQSNQFENLLNSVVQSTEQKLTLENT